MKNPERIKRIIARGEHSNHCHVIVGDDVQIERTKNNDLLLKVGDKGALLRHLLESNWLNGEEVWTGEHHDIEIAPREYKYIPQIEYHPYNDEINKVKD